MPAISQQSGSTQEPSHPVTKQRLIMMRKILDLEALPGATITKLAVGSVLIVALIKKDTLGQSTASDLWIGTAARQCQERFLRACSATSGSRESYNAVMYGLSFLLRTKSTRFWYPSMKRSLHSHRKTREELSHVAIHTRSSPSAERRKQKRRMQTSRRSTDLEQAQLHRFRHVIRT